MVLHSCRHLEMVRALAQHRHFGRAAQALGGSQPSLTRSLEHLGKMLGVRLFERQDVVIASDGLAAPLPALIERELSDGLCVLLPIEPPWTRLNYGFVWKRGRTHSPAANAFMQLVRALEKETPG